MWFLFLSLVESQHLPMYLFPLDINMLTNFNNKIVTGTNVIDLYDEYSFRSFNMIINPINFSIMTSNPVLEKDVGCLLITDYNTEHAKVLNNVKCSFKGSVGSLRICLDEYGNDNGNCRRLSLQVKSKPSKYIFNGMASDLSLMSERTAFYLMNKFGMYAPLSSHAKLFLNGKYVGIYSFVEPIDETFTKTRFGNDKTQGKGGLYKDLWFNPLHFKDIKDAHKDGLDEKEFLKRVMAGILTTTESKKYLMRYFDMASFINMTAFNTAIGNTDDWRQRHNFYVYVRLGRLNQKKIVFLPWDYDRLYDQNSANRGALKGSPWWDYSRIPCNIMIISSQEKAQRTAQNLAQITWYKDIYDQLPPDVDVPITCDKFTRMIADAYGNEIRQRTKYFINRINLLELRNKWNTWTNQIRTALQYDIKGPTISDALLEQQKLYNSFTFSMQKALSEIALVETG